MKKFLLSVTFLCAGTNFVSAGEWSEEYKQNLRDAVLRRRAEVQRHNFAQAEAVRLVTQGLGALSRPSDPWNVPRRPPPRTYYRPSYRYRCQ